MLVCNDCTIRLPYGPVLSLDIESSAFSESSTTRPYGLSLRDNRPEDSTADKADLCAVCLRNRIVKLLALKSSKGENE